MCGRFALGIPKVRLEEVFGIAPPEDYSPRYNIAPGSESLAIVAPEGEKRPAYLRWGLVPHWARDTNMGFAMINARSETVFEKSAFRDSILVSRCLIPAQAFYEWKIEGGKKQPYAVGLNDTDVFAMAGISALWEDHATGESVESFTVLTCAPNTLLKTIHDRMPVILPSDAWSDWLDPEAQDPEQIGLLLGPYPAEGMRIWPVGPSVNAIVNDSPNLLERADVIRQGHLI